MTDAERLLQSWGVLFAHGITLDAIADAGLSDALDQLRTSRLELAALVAEEARENPLAAD